MPKRRTLEKSLPRAEKGLTRVAAYNLHGETNGWGPDRFLPYDYTQELERLHADVLILPEVWFPTPADSKTDISVVRRWLTDNDFNRVSARAAICTPRRARLGEERDAHVVLATRHPILETREYLLPKHRRDTSTSRSCVAALVDTPASGPLWVVGVHLSANVPWAPLNNVRHLRRFVLELERDEYPVVIAGDFNLWGWWVRCTLRNGHRRAATGRTWPTWAPHSQIDHILHTKNIHVRQAAVLPVMHSDHRAIYADLLNKTHVFAAPHKLPAPPE